MFKVIAFLIEVVNWFRIILFPSFVGVIMGGLFYYLFQNYTGKVLWIVCSIFGVVFGVIWASRIWKKQGTTTFMSKVIATPELDKLDENEENK
jgi:drug/metabolite transporter (DMT)-like permease